MFKKILAICIFALTVFTGGNFAAINHAEAGIATYFAYYENNHNYKRIDSHANWRCYLDTTSCAFTYNNDDEYQFAMCIVNAVMGDNDVEASNTVLYIKQKKDGYSRPQYRYQNQSTWTTIPRPNSNGNYAGLGYKGYVEKYHPTEYSAFRTCYRILWGVDFSEL